MGWDQSLNWSTKKVAIRDVLAEYQTESDYVRHTLQAYKQTKQALWVVLKRKDTGAMFIVANLFERRGGLWAVKKIHAASHPFVYDCPLEFLDLESEPGSYFAEFKECVFKFHGVKK